jgi:deoxyribodipyrimidine photo-lyase
MHLIWFRNDLRLHDHAALWHAAQSRQCLALVILSPEQWQLHQDAPIKIDFYLRRLKIVKQQLEALNIPLLILNIPLWPDIPEQLLALCQQFQISTVYYNIETGLNEQQRDQAVEQLLQQHQISCEYYEDRTLFPLGSIRNQSQQPYHSIFLSLILIWINFLRLIGQRQPTRIGQLKINTPLNY